ncbi:pickpocket protein 19 [Musca vetustissima]|uniref:pickpocket protein 19 n=1 Tax=Musca vetustissima TaxID=27455 RepID=UPI002AB75FEF|nr:pickpocket protein 19 [Musca vetustissima]
MALSETIPITTTTNILNSQKQSLEMTNHRESLQQKDPSFSGETVLGETEKTNCPRCTNRGVSYYMATNHSPKGKCFRAFIVLLATACAAYVCLLSSRRYFHTWVQTVIERTDVHVSEIPFPAVTICPVKGLNLLRLEQEATTFLGATTTQEQQRQQQQQQHERITDKELQDLHMLLNTLNELMWPSMNHVDGATSDAEKIMQHQSNQTMNVIEEFLESLTPSSASSRKVPNVVANLKNIIDLGELMSFLSFECEDIFAECVWRRVKMPCCDLFRKVHTYKGICYSFNSILVENPIPSWPWVMAESGLHSGLRVHIKRGSIGRYYEKVAVMVHDPTEFGSTDVTYMDSERVVITVNPLRFTADYDIHTLKPELRHCYFTNELKLLGKGRGNCIRNCRLKYIERYCNCTYFFPVAIKRDESLPICKAPNLKCIYSHRDIIWSTANVIQESPDGIHFQTHDCQCYPNCNYIQYRTAINTDHSTNMDRASELIDLTVQYQHDTLFSYRSSLCFTLLDLIVSYGGIAGLFLGFSLIGVIEVLHDFIILRKCRKKDAESETSSASTSAVGEGTTTTTTTTTLNAGKCKCQTIRSYD